MIDAQQQIDTRAIELAAKAHTRIDGLETIVNVQMEGIRRDLEANRSNRTEQHAEITARIAENQQKNERYFGKIFSLSVSGIVGAFTTLVSVLGYLLTHGAH